jgi:hypothetical protein
MRATILVNVINALTKRSESFYALPPCKDTWKAPVLKKAVSHNKKLNLLTV